MPTLFTQMRMIVLHLQEDNNEEVYENTEVIEAIRGRNAGPKPPPSSSPLRSANSSPFYLAMEADQDGDAEDYEDIDEDAIQQAAYEYDQEEDYCAIGLLRFVKYLIFYFNVGLPVSIWNIFTIW